jgi:hypothetical protein
MNIKELLKSNNFKGCIEELEKLENKEDAVRDIVISNFEDYGLILLNLLTDIAHRRNNIFWYMNLAFLYSFNFHYLDSGEQTALYYFLKAHKLDEENITIIECILDFSLPPEVILSPVEVNFYVEKLRIIDPTNSRIS